MGLMSMKKPIRILSNSMDILGEIDNYESMSFTRSWFGIGEIELRINRYKKYANTLLKDHLILIGNDLNKIFLIKHREIELDENGKITENWLIRGYALKSIIAQRITVPPSHTAYDNKSGSVETVMKHYINTNLVNPIDIKRKIPQLVIAPDLERGGNISYSSRYKNLGEEMSTLAMICGLAWDVTLDITNKVWVFDVIQGRDLSINQTVLPPVVFSPQFESLKSMQYVQSDLNYKNFGYVAGQGEGVERRIVEVGSFDGLSRHEIFIDARDVEEMDENENPLPVNQIVQTLTERGQQQLNELIQEEYLEGQILTNSPFRYQIDYDCGDVATIQNVEWKVTMDARITEIKEIYEETGFRIEAVFGNNRPTLIQKIKQELAQISPEIRR